MVEIFPHGPGVDGVSGKIGPGPLYLYNGLWAHITALSTTRPTNRFASRTQRGFGCDIPGILCFFAAHIKRHIVLFPGRIKIETVLLDVADPGGLVRRVQPVASLVIGHTKGAGFRVGPAANSVAGFYEKIKRPFGPQVTGLQRDQPHLRQL